MLDLNFVYWIYDESCENEFRFGYVGVTCQLGIRLRTHIRSKRVPENSTIRILFSGTREECFQFEKLLRPQKGIGWNNAPGGSHGWRVGFTHSDDSIFKMKNAWTTNRRNQASKRRKELNKTFVGQKRLSQSIAMMGENNPMFGKKRPPYIGEAVRKARLGKPSANRQEIYCVRCRKRVSLSILKKYHSKCIIEHDPV